MSWASEQVERYRELEPLLDAFVERLHDLLETLFDDEELPFWHSYSWTRRAGRFATPADVEAMAAVVARELDVDYAHSLPPAAAGAENERRLAGDATALRYKRAGYVASLGESRRRLGSWSGEPTPACASRCTWRRSASTLPGRSTAPRAVLLAELARGTGRAWSRCSCSS